MKTMVSGSKVAALLQSRQQIAQVTARSAETQRERQMTIGKCIPWNTPRDIHTNAKKFCTIALNNRCGVRGGLLTDGPDSADKVLRTVSPGLAGDVERYGVRGGDVYERLQQFDKQKAAHESKLRTVKSQLNKVTQASSSDPREHPTHTLDSYRLQGRQTYPGTHLDSGTTSCIVHANWTAKLGADGRGRSEDACKKMLGARRGGGGPRREGKSTQREDGGGRRQGAACQVQILKTVMKKTQVERQRRLRKRRAMFSDPNTMANKTKYPKNTRSKLVLFRQKTLDPRL
ncbi:hypothetical protein R3P38DRAFT_2786880 [Favolaschia claudopus]|uniref:Uncharacterized protein n=1 Tax=Favolaschia claudopus TaxID=2862362 RepID=A0AAW0AR36_9AGAR